MRLEQLFGKHGEAVAEAAVRALSGDTQAMALVLSRLMPPAKDRPIWIAPPTDPAEGMATIVAAVAGGVLLPGDGERLAGLIRAKAEMTTLAELEARLTALEGNR